MRVVFALLAAFTVLLSGGLAGAHGMRSAYLEITEQPGCDEAGCQALARFRITVAAQGVGPVFPDGCTASREGAPVESDSGDVRAYRLACPRSLRNARVGVTGLGPNVPEGVVHVTLADGSLHTKLLSGADPFTRVPDHTTPLRVARDFVAHGLRHILSGADHLLFLGLLVLTLKKVRPVLIAEGAFTVSHTLAFAATALGWIRVSAPAAEACIALSLVLVALDLGGRRAPPGTAHTAGLALVFGVVHGLGFAGGLREVGLPEDHVASALAGFGAGVEVGQLAVCAVGLALMRALARWRHEPRFVRVAAYASGAVASAWLLERLTIVLTRS